MGGASPAGALVPLNTVMLTLMESTLQVCIPLRELHYEYLGYESKIGERQVFSNMLKRDVYLGTDSNMFAESIDKS